MNRRPPWLTLFAISVILASFVNLIVVHYVTSRPREVIHVAVEQAAAKGIPTAIAEPKVPLKTAVQKGNVGLVQQHMHWCRKNGGCDLNRDLQLAASGSDPTVAKVILTAGANVNAVDKDRDTPLHVTATTGRVRVAEVLLEAGANVNAPNASGDTPLHSAAGWGHVELTRLLLASGADPNLTDDRGDTALHLVASRPVPPLAVYADVAKLLLARGARVDLRDASGQTPLELAKASSARLKLDGNLKAAGDANEVASLLSNRRGRE